MSQDQQQQQEQPREPASAPLLTQNTSEIPQAFLPPSMMMMQMPFHSQMPAPLTAHQQAQPDSTMGVPMQVNANPTLAHFVPLQPQPPQQNQAIMNSMPAVWTDPSTSSSANYNVARIANWVPGQGSLPQNSALHPFPASGSTYGNDSAVAVSLKSAPTKSTTSNHLVEPDSKKDRKKGSKSSKRNRSAIELSTAEKTKHNRERNREHARSTRLRKKAYVQELREMADGLRVVQTNEIRQRKLAVKKMMSAQKARRTMIQTVLSYHSSYESDPVKWGAILEDSFWFKQPITPFRSFRRSEVEKDCRMIHGIDAMICDAASLSVMVERVGSRNSRWQQLKRKPIIARLEESSPNAHVLNRDSQQGESSLSSESSSDSSCAANEMQVKKRDYHSTCPTYPATVHNEAKKVSSSSESCDGKNTTTSAKDHFEDSRTTAADAEPLRKRQKASKIPDQPQGSLVSNNVTSESEACSAVNQQRLMGPSPLILSSLTMFEESEKEISCYYSMNEDDMIMIDEVMMCPFVFRSKNAVFCGALADCVMPGMLRATFSKSNKLQSLEIVFDAMGFMQQLDGANGREIIPGSLEIALMNSPDEARVITEARPPFSIVHVNEAWTRLTKYTQVEVEGNNLRALMEGSNTDPYAGARPGKPIHKPEEVSKGRPACSTNIHYDKFGNPFVDFVSSYPLTNGDDEISHLLHVCQELPEMKVLI